MDPSRPATTGSPAAAGPPTGGYTLVGWPLGFSLSPAMHNAAFAALGIDATYGLCPTPPDDLPTTISALRTGALAGANVTVPYKVDIRRLLDDESDLVAAIGAVNTVVRTADGLRGENTDAEGFRRALEVVDLLEGHGKRAVVLGAGGAARAVVHTLLGARYSVRVLNRGAARSGVLAAQLYRAHPGAVIATGPLAAETVVAEGRRADLLVNATGVGSAPSPWRGQVPTGLPASQHADGARRQALSPAARERNLDCLWPGDIAVPSHLTVIDIVAWPLETSLVVHARACGARAMGGLEMLLGQAARSFRLWTGIEPPLDVMRRAALEAKEAAAASMATASDTSPTAA